MSAVVFDCDGVLVDTEPLSAKAWRRVLLEFGYSASDEDLAACVGRTRSDTYRYFAGLHPLPDIEVLSNAVADAIAPLLDAGVEPFPDAVNTVKELALHGVPLAVASSSRRTELDLKLQQTDLRRYFDVSVAGDEVEAGKPAPDLFLAAATGLGVDPRSCVVVEDSEPGVAAAQAAGMRVITVVRGGVVIAGSAAVDPLDAGLILTWLGLR